MGYMKAPTPEEINAAERKLAAIRIGQLQEQLELAKYCLQGLLDVLSGKNKEFAKLLVEFGHTKK